MRFVQFGLMAAVGTFLALPVSAQTTQTSPGKPTPALATPTPTSTPGKPAPAAMTPGSAATAPPTASAAAGIIDINSASVDDLDKLPGIGKARAEAIIKNRPYRGKDDLLGRHVVPPNIYNGIKDKIIAKQG